MLYYNFKEIQERKNKVNKHLDYISIECADEIQKCIDDSIIYKNDFKVDTKIPYKGIDILITQETSTDCIFKTALPLKTKKICVLNFASYRHPGGMFTKGSTAQEEELCISSILYPILKHFTNSYYKINEHELHSGLYKNTAIYTPNVLFMYDKNKTANVDVLTCAAPNRRYALDRGVQDDVINSVMKDRIKFIFDIAEDNNVDTFILGAWGCGVFRNDPEIVAKLFKDEIYKRSIPNIIFPIPDSTTFETFMEVLI